MILRIDNVTIRQKTVQEKRKEKEKEIKDELYTRQQLATRMGAPPTG